MSDQDRISPYNINTISIRQEIWIKKNVNLGIISWSSYENCMIDSKENNKFDLGVKELNKMHDNSAYSQVWHFNCPITLSNYKHDT